MEPNKAVDNRNADGTFGPGNNANPLGRPKGQSLKEFWRQRFAEMSDEEKIEFTNKVGNEGIWKMAEGNPATNTDITSGGKEIPLNLIHYGDNKPTIHTEDISTPTT